MCHSYIGRLVTVSRMREMSVAEQRYKAALAVIAGSCARAQSVECQINGLRGLPSLQVEL